MAPTLKVPSGKIIHREGAFGAQGYLHDLLLLVLNEDGSKHDPTDGDTTATTRTPQFGDVVEFEYTMKTLDGRTIYSEEELPRRTYAMDQEELFSGLREGLKLMHEGETVTFLFPSHKAYGYYGDKNRIGTNLPILSTVTLYSITSNNNNQNQD